MLLIQINSLPFEQGREIGAILTGVSHDFSEGVGIDLAQVTATWEYWEPWHDASAGRAAVNQPNDSHPILVDLLVPEFYSPERVEQRLECLAAGIAASEDSEEQYLHQRERDPQRPDLSCRRDRPLVNRRVKIDYQSRSGIEVGDSV